MAIEAISLRRVSREDLADVEAIFDDLRGYSLRVDGATKQTGGRAVLRDRAAARSGPDRKHCFIAIRQDGPFGLLDVIQDHPVRGTAFIGLLAVREALHGAGLGVMLFSAAERFIRVCGVLRPRP